MTSDTISSRPLGNFHPTIWGDYFLAHATNIMAIDSTKNQEHEELKEKVRKILVEAADDDFRNLELINAVQRLGVSYHFGTEIEEALQKLYHQTTHLDHHDLYSAALRFRLLRQQGHGVSCDIFNKFIDEEGNFKGCLIPDIRGMLSLYEAANLSTYADEILDKAMAFTTYHLHEFSMVKDGLFAKQVIRALDRPLRKGMPRLETRYFISVYQDDVSHNETLHRFAKLDFNMIQAQHQEELGHISRWWKDLNVPTKFPYARDRVVELYFWITGVYFEPCYRTGRRVLTKAICMISLMDDTYDAYATIEESELLTKAMDRWDISCMNELPEYMKFLYGETITMFDEFEKDIIRDGKPYRVNYAKNAIIDLAKGYLNEARWCHEGYIPTMEKYNILGLVTSTHPLLTTVAFLGMGDIATDEGFHWLSTKPMILRASSYISRVLNDIVSHKAEQSRGSHIASAVECYMKQYGVTEEDAIVVLRKQVRDAWKDINEEFLQPPKDVPASLLERMLNLTRIIDVVYKDDDKYTKADLIKEAVSSVLMEPIAV